MTLVEKIKEIERLQEEAEEESSFFWEKLYNIAKDVIGPDTYNKHLREAVGQFGTWYHGKECAIFNNCSFSELYGGDSFAIFRGQEYYKGQTDYYSYKVPLVWLDLPDFEKYARNYFSVIVQTAKKSRDMAQLKDEQLKKEEYEKLKKHFENKEENSQVH